MNFLIFGTLWFWVAVAAVVVGIIWLLESALDESSDSGGGGWATVIIIAFVIAYYKFGSSEDVINILTYVRDHPGTVIGLFFGYVACGLLWAFFKWYFFLQSLKQKAKESMERAMEYRNVPHKITIPKASDNKYRIMSWMYYWPFSGAWTMINEPFKKSFEYLYAKSGVLFNKISERAFGDLVKENEELIKVKEAERDEEQNKYKGSQRRQLNS